MISNSAAGMNQALLVVSILSIVVGMVHDLHSSAVARIPSLAMNSFNLSSSNLAPDIIPDQDYIGHLIDCGTNLNSSSHYELCLAFKNSGKYALKNGAL